MNRKTVKLEVNYEKEDELWYVSEDSLHPF